ncbi:MAG TPA: hypothetical protein VM779_01845 [Thermoanaerobaculia bacterium]|nr:hypothetical protein [Thermoanaerobaculia bacterium]
MLRRPDLRDQVRQREVAAAVEVPGRHGLPHVIVDGAGHEDLLTSAAAMRQAGAFLAKE